MNVPNQLTLSRFVLTAAFLVAFLARFPFSDTVALLLFGAASLTDYFDGKIARRDKLITNFGILMDPLADKVLICAAFIAFVERGLMPAWMVIIVVTRELAITGLRLLAASKNLVLAAERYGQNKTISQITAIIAVLVLESYETWGALGVPFGLPILGRPWVSGFSELSKWVAVILTFVSGWLYLWRNRELYMSDL